MAGRVLGRYFKQVVVPLLASGPGDAQREAHAAVLDDSAELPWSEYVAAVSRAAAGASRAAQLEVGKAVIREFEAEFVSWGFDALGKFLADWDAPFGAAILDAPPEQTIHTAKYEPGHALFFAGEVQPPALVEGLLRGVVETFGGEVIDLDCHRVRVDGVGYHLFELRWRGAASDAPTPRGRRSWDRSAANRAPASNVA